MAAQIIDGKLLSNNLLNKIKLEIKALKTENKRLPSLAVILIGNDPASSIYVNKKQEKAREIGINTLLFNYKSNITEQDLLAKIYDLNKDTTVDGILVQLPLPQHINKTLIINAISPSKDVDGFHPCNIGALALRQSQLSPCTPAGIITLLKSTGVPIKGLNITILGASNIVGRPMLLEALLHGATPTVCHRFTNNIQEYIQRADCLISAVGQPHFVSGEWIKKGSIVIDVGINRLSSGKIVGDVDFNSAQQYAGWITPVPGGVGPMTVAKLMENTLKAYRMSKTINN